MDNYYLKMAQELSLHSHCLKRKVGAVLVSADGAQIVTAVNDPMPDSKVCEEKGCLRNTIPSGTQLDICRCLHSETKLITQCAQKGISTLNATVYTTLTPCLFCAKVLISAGVKRIVYSNHYTDERSIELFTQAHIQVDQL